MANDGRGFGAPEDRQSLHMNSHCFRLALAIHDATGWSLVGVRCFGKKNEAVSLIGHCGVRTPEGWFLDARGPLDEKGFLSGLAEASRYATEPLSREHVEALRQQAYEGPEDSLSDATVHRDAAALVESIGGAQAPLPEIGAVRDAFRAGWRTSAIPPDQHDAGPDYVQACEEADWQVWKQKHVTPGQPVAGDLAREAFQAGWAVNASDLNDHQQQSGPYSLAATGYLIWTSSEGEVSRIEDQRIGVLYDARENMVVQHGGTGGVTASALDILDRLANSPSPLADQLREDLAVVTAPVTPATLDVLNRFVTTAGRPATPTIPEELRSADPDVSVTRLQDLAAHVPATRRSARPH